MEVSGGAGGTAADLDAMGAAGARLLGCGGRLEELAGRLAAIGTDADLLATAPLDPAGLLVVQGRLLTLLAGPSGLTALGIRSAALGTAVATAARAYADGDRAVGVAFAAARDSVAGAVGQGILRGGLQYAAVVAPVVGVAALALAVWRTGDLVVAAVDDAVDDARDGRLELDSLDDRAEALAALVTVRLLDDARTAGTAGVGWLGRHPELAEELVAASPSFLSGLSGAKFVATQRFGQDGEIVTAGRWSFPPQDVDDLAAFVALVGYGSGLLGRGPVHVRPAVVRPPQPVHPPRGVADLVGGAVALAPARDGTVTGEPGRIRVERVRSAAGTAAVVYVPATQTWDAGHTANPMDATSNLDALAGLESPAQSGVVQALRAAGVERDEPLLLVGYSQGGLTSMALASDPGFAQEFSPAAVLTVGSPVARFAVADDVSVLSVEHAEDLVTVADGADNPDRPNWTTVTRHLLDSAAGDDVVRAAMPEDPFAAHRPEPYQATADRVDASDDESVLAWKRSAARFLDAPGATSTATDWVAERDTSS